MADEHEKHHADEAAPSNGTSGDCFEQASNAISVAASEGPEWDERPSPWSTAGAALSKTIYATCYYCSFGVVFPTMFVVGLIPKENAIVHGLVDGAAAARDTVNKRSAKHATNGDSQLATEQFAPAPA